MTSAIRVTITGAAGQIGYQLAFRIASGEVFGPNQPVILQLLEIPPALNALQGVQMELDDCTFSALDSIVATDQPNVAFRDADYALLVGAKPRGAGMERADLLLGNAQIFSAQGKVLNEHASRDIKVLVVGNPANTNALIAQKNAPDINPTHFTAMTRLDHNRALAQLARKTGVHASSIKRMTIWGNHSSTQYPDISHSTIDGRPAGDIVETAGTIADFLPTVQQRGAEIIKARGASSAASAASAVIDHVRDWVRGTPSDDWVSMAIPADGSYGISEGVIYSFPVTCSAGSYQIVQDLEISDFSHARMDETDAELREERAAVANLL